MSTAYATRPSFSLLSHWGMRRSLMVGDYIAVDTDKVDVQIKSGDYFVTLATSLELISQRLETEHNDVAKNIEQAVNELLYLQSGYKVVKKTDK